MAKCVEIYDCQYPKQNHRSTTHRMSVRAPVISERALRMRDNVAKSCQRIQLILSRDIARMTLFKHKRPKKVLRKER